MSSKDKILNFIRSKAAYGALIHQVLALAEPTELGELDHDKRAELKAILGELLTSNEIHLDGAYYVFGEDNRAKPSRTTAAAELSSKQDNYTFCPNCGSLNMIRDLRDSINDCHDCGFNHFVGVETLQQAFDRHDLYIISKRKEG